MFRIRTVLFASFLLLLLTPLRAADPLKISAEGHSRKTIYVSPEKPGYTCWVGAWIMPDRSLMVCFTQATGPVKDRPRAPAEIQRKLDWPPGGMAGYDMTGLDLRNVHLRSTDGGETWTKVSADPFRSLMNGVTGECESALADGSVLRGVYGLYLPYNPELPQTGFLQRSTDSTKTWGPPEVLLDPQTSTCWPRRLRPLRDGRLVLVGGLARVSSKDKTRQQISDKIEPLMLVSEDNGKTWSGPLEVVPEDQRTSWYEEWDVAELENGDLLAVFRRPHPETKQQVRWQGLLRKEGKGWKMTDLRAAPFPHSGHPELLAAREGVVLHVATSGIDWTADAGKTWHKLDVPGSAYYPRSVQTADGTIHVFAHVGSDDAYGAREQSIVMDTFRLKRE